MEPKSLHDKLSLLSVHRLLVAGLAGGFCLIGAVPDAKAASSRDPFIFQPSRMETRLNQGFDGLRMLPAMLNANCAWVQQGMRDPDCQRGVALLNKANWIDAQSAFDSALRRNRANAVAAEYAGIAVVMHIFAEQDRTAHWDYEKWKRARSYYSKAVALQPQDSIVHRNSAMLCADYSECDPEPEFRVATALAPHDPRCSLVLANWLNRRRKVKEAMNIINAMIEEYPKSAQLYFLRANMSTTMEKNAEAIKDYSRCLALDPNFYSALYERGVAKVALEQYKSALADLTGTVKSAPKWDEAWNYRSLAYAALGDYESALKDARKAVELCGGTCLSFRQNLVWSLVRTHRYPEALSLMNALLKENPRNGPMLYCRAMVLAQTGKVDAALHDLDSSLFFRPNEYSTLLLRAHLYEVKGNYEQSLIDFADAKRALADNQHIMTTTMATESGGIMHNVPDKAKRETERELLKGLQKGARLDKKQIDDTIRGYSKIITISPKHADLYWERAIVYMCSGRYESALSDLKQFRSLDHTPDLNATAALYQSVCCDQLQRKVEAVELLTQASKLPVKDQFVSKLIAFNAGKSTERALLGYAHNVQNTMRASFAVAMKYLRDGNKAEAIKELAIIENSADTEIDEYSLAISILPRLRNVAPKH